MRLQPKQEEFRKAVMRCPVVFYGGAKGGGKSYAIRNILLELICQYPNSKALLVRKTYDELVSNHIDAFFRENPGLIKYYRAGDRKLILPNGSSLSFRHLQFLSDVYVYQGQEFDFIGIDEITQHEKEVFTVLRSSNRTTNSKIKPKFLLTGNPGGIGHVWVKNLFISHVYEMNERPNDYAFIPASVRDNKVLLTADPEYIARLEALPEHLRKAYLEGDWDIFAGQYFAEWRREEHVCEPFEIPNTWKRFRGIDFGREAPFCCLWFALDYDGNVWAYKEYYQAGKDADENAAEVLWMSEKGKDFRGDPIYEHYEYSVADSSIFAKTGHGEPISEILARHKIITIPSSKDRIAGWTVMHQYLRTPQPKLIFFNTCANAIRTIPSLIHDENHPEDLDSFSEDHCADAVRYFLQTLRERHTLKPLTGIEKRISELKRGNMEYGGYDPKLYDITPGERLTLLTFMTIIN